MGINQIGSVLYAYLLGIYPEEYSLIWANSLTVLVAFTLDKMMQYYSASKGKGEEGSQGSSSSSGRK